MDSYLLFGSILVTREGFSQAFIACLVAAVLVLVAMFLDPKARRAVPGSDMPVRRRRYIVLFITVAIVLEGTLSMEIFLLK